MSVEKKIPVDLFQVVKYFEVSEKSYRKQRKRFKTFLSRFFFLMLM